MCDQADMQVLPLLIWLCLMLPAGVAALAIANETSNGESGCFEQEYIVDLQTFLNLAAVIPMASTGVTFCASRINKNLDKKQKILEKITGYLMWIPCCCVALFSVIWAVIGMIMYSSQMSSVCQKESSGKMVLAWCIVQFCLLLAACCGICSVVASFAMWAILGSQKQ